MGLLDWVTGAPKSEPRPGPTPEGLYGSLPKGARWQLGPDPVGDPHLFVPAPNELAFDLVKWDWQSALKAVALVRWQDKLVGLGFVLGVSDGTAKDGAEQYGPKQSKPSLTGKYEWTIPKGHPTREMFLESIGEPTSNLLALLEECFGQLPTGRSAPPANSGHICQFVILRGRIEPETGRFTARLKVILPEGVSGKPYCEFFLNVNSIIKKIWVSEKDTNYRNAILNWIAA